MLKVKLFEGKLKTKIKKVSLVGIDQVFRSGLRFACNLAIARLCTKADFAFYVLFISFFNCANYFVASFINAPYMVFIHDRAIKEKTLYNAFIRFLTVICIVFCCFVYLALYHFIFENDFQHFGLILISVLLLASDLVTQVIRAVFIGTFKYAPSLKISSTMVLIWVSGMLGLFLSGKANLRPILLLTSLAYGVPSVFIYLKNVQCDKFSTWIRACSEFIVKHVKFGRWLLLNAYMGATIPYLIPFIMKFSILNSLIPVYGVCLVFFSVFNPLTIVFGNIFAPSFAKAYQVSMQTLLRKAGQAVLIMLIIGCGLVFFSSVFGSKLITIVYGKYHVPTTVMLVWGVSKAIQFINNVLNSFAKAIYRPHIVFI